MSRGMPRWRPCEVAGRGRAQASDESFASARSEVSAKFAADPRKLLLGKANVKAIEVAHAARPAGGAGYLDRETLKRSPKDW
jgi:hypothetical protein|mmetsp:Transcript_56332/g.154792  ORF Transcript_56332/g.154792 Transcript_56332/m.154792 type:complete len:82 (+) Transcript_56332:179-424(+)